jgi:hypothetical protein
MDVDQTTLCLATFSVNGTFQPALVGQVQGGNEDPGCAPTGEVAATIGGITDMNGPGCNPSEIEAHLNPVYSYQITIDGDNNQSITYAYDGDPQRNDMQVEAAGGGCELTASHMDPDGTAQVLIKPFWVDGVFSGRGYIELYRAPVPQG